MDTMIRNLISAIQNHIRFRAILMIVATTLVGSITLIMLTKMTMNEGFLRYVNSEEKLRVEKLIVQLEKYLPAYLENSSNPHSWWPKLVNSTLPESAEEWQRPASPLSAGFNPNELERSRISSLSPKPTMFNEQPRWNMTDGKFVDGSQQQGFPPRREAGSSLFEHRLMLLDADKNLIIGANNHPDEMLYPITANGQTIAFLGHIPHQKILEATEVQFVQDFNGSLLWIWVISCGVTLAMAYPWAHGLIKTVESFNASVRQLALGTYKTRLPIKRRDELGHLACDINHLAKVLEKNEKARQQWIADISHELRNPLAIMQAEVEAVQDGVRENSDATFKSLHYNVIHLSHLVNDLYELSLSDIGALSYNKIQASPVAMLEQCVDLYSDAFEEKTLTLGLHYEGNPELMRNMMIELDQNRIQQLFSNLIKNSLKYTDSGGVLKIEAQMIGEHKLLFSFYDSAPGLSDDEMNQIFERLYRTDRSRTRQNNNGAGLGLAICNNIADAHGMTLSAEHSSLGGVCMKLVIRKEV
ncbi:ATP-binding protein [Photobacterium makurazakiensis]|uniref:ATP-binding protein n=1 Tax=Photobacterium makurazakiensis TaxID=2910234 RepID=UPI003D0B52F1